MAVWTHRAQGHIRFLTSRLAENWALVCRDNVVFSLFSANITHFLWLIFKPQHKPFIFLALQGYCFLQSCAPALSESLTWPSGNSRNSGSAQISLCGLFVPVLTCPLNCGSDRHKYCLLPLLGIFWYIPWNCLFAAPCPGHLLPSLCAWTDSEGQQFSAAAVTLSAGKTDPYSSSSTQFLLFSSLTKELLSC